MSKYHAKKTVVDGIKFDSKKEAQRYVELKLMEQCGDITELILQPEFELQPKYRKNGKTVRAVKYVADFAFYDKDGNYIIEDVKSEFTRKDKVYLLKKKLFEYKYNYAITEIL